MGNDGESLEELRQAVEADPDDSEPRRRYVEALLGYSDIVTATEQMRVLLRLQPDNDEILSLGIRVADAAGDSLMVARLRRQLTTGGNYEPDDQFVNGALAHGPHPAHPSVETPSSPRLRLLAGGLDRHAVDPEATRPGRRLEDIAGLATVKRGLAEIIERARADDTQHKDGWLGGVLMYGPRSCGKHFATEVIAGELDAPLLTYDFSSPSAAPDLRTSIDRLSGLRDTDTTVVHLENIDDRNAQYSMSLLLPALDELSRSTRVVMVGSALLPWQVSQRIVRPGRLGSVLLVLPPDAPARRQFLTLRIQDRVEINEQDLDWIVNHTEGHSFGDLDALMLRAAELSNVAEPTTTEFVFTRAGIRNARQEVHASSAEWLSSAGHHALMNEAGGLYDDLLMYFHTRQRR